VRDRSGVVNTHVRNFLAKKIYLVNGSFLVLNITFSYFIYRRYGDAHLWQYFLP